MNAFNLRTGKLIPEGSSSKVYNVTDTDTNVTYAMKALHDDEALVAEIAAYERIKLVPALRNRVPQFHGVANFPPQNSIFLEKVDGETLDTIIHTLSPTEREDMENYLLETLRILHRDARLYHRGIQPGKILVQGGRATLLGFGLATMQEDVDEESCKYREDHDKLKLGVIFEEVAQEEIDRDIKKMVERLRHPNHGIVNSQYKLSLLLSRHAYPTTKLLESILEVFPDPAPVLVLPLAHCIAFKHRHRQAVDILLKCGQHFEPEPPLCSAFLLGMLLEMKENAARYSMEIYNKEAWSAEIFEDAINFYLRWIPEGAGPRDEADEKVLELRFELANHLSYSCAESQSLVVCERALDRAKATGRPIREGSVRDFKKVIDRIMSVVEHDLNRIRKDRMRGVEHKSDPWSKQAEYEEIRNRAERRLATCNELLSGETGWEKQ